MMPDRDQVMLLCPHHHGLPAQQILHLQPGDLTIHCRHDIRAPVRRYAICSGRKPNARLAATSGLAASAAMAQEADELVTILLSGPAGHIALSDAPESAAAGQPPREMSPQAHRACDRSEPRSRPADRA